MKSTFLQLGLIFSSAASSSLVAALEAATGTRWATIAHTDSYGQDVWPEGFTGEVDPDNVEQECKAWCLTDATCTMFLTGTNGVCYIKTGNPNTVAYQYGGPTAPYNIVLRDMDCPTASALTNAYLDSEDTPPPCTESIGNTADGTDQVPDGSLNAPCVNLQGCRNGNVCDVYSGDVYLCKAPLGANCRDVTDCSNTIIDPLCTLEGGQNGNRICAVTAAAPGASQLVERRKRNVMRSKISRNLDNQCPLRTIACPTASGNSFECVNTAEELAHCGECGNDCQQLEGVHPTGVMCSSGQCLVYRCRSGFELVDNACLAL